MMRRVLVVALGLMTVGVVTAIYAGGNEQPGSQPKPTTDINKVKDKLTLEEKKLSEQFGKFMQQLYQLKERMEKGTAEDKAFAKILEKVIDRSKNYSIDVQFQQLVELMKDEKFGSLNAVKEAKEKSQKLTSQLQDLLAILRQDRSLEDLKAQQAELQAILKLINDAIGDQKNNQANTENHKFTGGDPKNLQQAQKDISNKLDQIAKKLDGKEGDKGGGQGSEAKNSISEAKSAGKGEGDKGAGKGEAKPGEGKNQGQGKGKDGDKGSQGAAKGGDDKKAGGEGQKGGEAGKGKDAGKGGEKGSQGEAKGGDKAGGMKGGDKAGGAKAGGDKAGGDKAGGAKAGGDKAGGDKSGSKAGGQGGDKAGGDKAGGDKAGGAKAGGMQGGDKAGGAKDDPKKGQPQPMPNDKGNNKADQKNASKGDQGKAKPGDKGDQGGSKAGGSKAGGKEGGSKAGGSKGGGEPKEGGEPGGGGSKGGDKGGDDSPKAQTKKQVQDADHYSKIAEKKLPTKPEDALPDEQKVIDNLEKAKKKLEDILRQLREEELERLLAALQVRCEHMLLMQIAVRDATVSISESIKKNNDKVTTFHKNDSLKQSDEEKKIVQEATKAIEMLEAEGSSVAFPEVFKQVREDMKIVAGRLEKADVGTVTVAIENDIIQSLEEMVAALKKARDDNKKKKGGKGGKGGESKPGDQKLLEMIAELKLIKSQQLKINSRTKLYGQQYQGEQATEAQIQRELQGIADNQEKIYDVTKRLSKGDNK